MQLTTGEGFWTPLVWVAAAVATVLLALLLWSRSQRAYKRGTEQDLPFVSGEKVEGAHVGGQHLYWGFVEGLKPLVDRLRWFHTGFVGDYVAWFVAILAVVLLIVLV